MYSLPSAASPHRIFCDHAIVRPAMVDAGVTPTDSHHDPVADVGSSAWASASAPAPFSPPVPCVSGSYPATGSAVYSSSALMAFGGSDLPNVRRLASMTCATTPVVTAADMLVPLNLR